MKLRGSAFAGDAESCGSTERANAGGMTHATVGAVEIRAFRGRLQSIK